MKYEILQLKEENIRAYGFMDYDWAIEHGFNEDDYEKVYEGILPDGPKDEDACEFLFYQFNMKRPTDFIGHSLSVSDIVILDGKKYYVEGIGFRKIS